MSALATPERACFCCRAPFAVDPADAAEDCCPRCLHALAAPGVSALEVKSSESTVRVNLFLRVPATGRVVLVTAMRGHATDYAWDVESAPGAPPAAEFGMTAAEFAAEIVRLAAAELARRGGQ